MARAATKPVESDNAAPSRTLTLRDLELPSAWDLAELGDLFNIQQGKALSPKHREGKSPRPFLRTANVLWGRVDVRTIDQMDFTGEEAARLSLRDGDLLVCEGGEVGRTTIWREEIEGCYFQNHLHRLRRKREDIAPEFYMYWMQAAVLYLGVYGGAENRTTIPNLSKARLSRFVVPVPPLEDQRAIASVLCAIQQAKEAAVKVIASTRQVKRSLMRHLFTCGPVPIAEPEDVELHETEIGPIPKHWAVIDLGDVITQAQYGLSIRGQGAARFPMLRMNNLNGGKLDTRDLQYVDLDGATFKKFRLEPGDLLFNRTNSYELVGKTALFEEQGDWVCASYLIRIRTDETQIRPHYLNYYLNWEVVQARLRMLATRGVSQSNISAAKLRTLKVALPPLDEQEAIAFALAAVDQKIDGEGGRRDASKKVFVSTLTQLMTGARRLEALEAAHG